MTTIPQLPNATSVTASSDQLPIQQGAITTAITPIALLQGAMAAWLHSLPTAPQPTPGWWNNSGIPTFS